MRASAGNKVLMLLENNPYQRDIRPRHEAAALCQAGYRVSVISPRLRGTPLHQVVDQVNVYQYPAPPNGNGLWAYLIEYGYSMLATFVLSWVVLFREGFDVIHAHNPPDTFFVIALFYKLLGKRFIFDHHDLAPEMYRARFRDGNHRLLYNLLVWFEKRSCRLADHVIATNESYRAVEIERSGVAPGRITIVRNGPDPHLLRPVEPDPALRQRARILLGYVGVMGPQDGLDYLLRTVRHLVYDFGQKDVLCVIIGKGDTLSQLKQLAEEWQIAQYVWFTGFIPDEDMIRTLSTVDICVDPDPSNPFNDRCTMIKMMEYMALSKPIAAFDLPEHRVTAQDAAVYAAANDERDLAARIIWLAEHPEERSRMGQFGRQRVETELAWSHQTPHLLQAYQAVGARRKTGA